MKKVTIALLLAALILSVSIPKADSKDEPKASFEYSSIVVKNKGEKPLIMFLLPEKEEYHVRNLKTLRMEFSGVYDPDECDGYPVLYDSCVIFRKEIDNKNQYQNIIQYFDEKTVEIKAFEIVHIIFDEDPIYIIHNKNEKLEESISAVQKGEVIWEKEFGTPFNNFINTDEVFDSHYWINTWDLEKYEAIMINTRTNEEIATLTGNTRVLSARISLQTIEKDKDRRINDYFFYDTKNKWVFHRILDIRDYELPIIHTDGDNLMLITPKPKEMNPSVNCDIKVINVDREEIHNGKLTLSNVVNLGSRTLSDYFLDLWGDYIMTWSYSPAQIEVINWKYNRIVYVDNLLNIDPIGPIGGSCWFQNNCIFYKSYFSYSGCIQLDGFIPLWRMETGNNVEYEVLDDLGYYIYRYPGKTPTLNDIKVRVKDITRDEFEPYSFEIDDVFYGINYSEHIIPTKYGILIIPQRNPAARGTRLYKPGIKEPVYEVYGLYTNQSNWYRVEDDDEHIKLSYSIGTSHEGEKDYHECLVEIKTGDVTYIRNDEEYLETREGN